MDQFDDIPDRYPDLFAAPRNRIVSLECLPGWYQIIDQLCGEIQSHLDANPTCPPVSVQQVKEKFGTLRFYYNGGDDVVDAMVSATEARSAHLCEVCGDAGHARYDSWIKTLCDTHHGERQLRREQRGW